MLVHLSGCMLVLAKAGRSNLDYPTRFGRVGQRECLVEGLMLSLPLLLYLYMFDAAFGISEICFDDVI